MINTHWISVDSEQGDLLFGDLEIPYPLSFLFNTLLPYNCIFILLSLQAYLSSPVLLLLFRLSENQYLLAHVWFPSVRVPIWSWGLRNVWDHGVISENYPCIGVSIWEAKVEPQKDTSLFFKTLKRRLSFIWPAFLNSSSSPLLSSSWSPVEFLVLCWVLVKAALGKEMITHREAAEGECCGHFSVIMEV